jgi:hypothetical protein
VTRFDPYSRPSSGCVRHCAATDIVCVLCCHSP